MTLRNAFENVSTEATLAELNETMQDLRTYIRADRPFARDASDRLRIFFDTFSISMVGGTYTGNANTYPAYYGIGGPNSMDAREVAEEQSVVAFQQTRTSRWVVT